MQISRRNFLKYCSASAAALGLTPQVVQALTRALENPSGPTVLWLQGACCSGCSVSLLNYVSTDPAQPADIADVLINVINLQYHPTLMAHAGDSSVSVLDAAYAAGDYLLVVEGGVPTAFGGAACWAWSENGVDVTFMEAVQLLAARAAAVVCVGTCSAYGGIPAAGPNPTGVQRVSQVLGRTTINVAGCPPHPNWVVYVIAQHIAGASIPLDAYGRPTALFSRRVHQDCPLRSTLDASNWGQQTRCKEELGCRGESTYGRCVFDKFNNGANWCIGAGASCTGCTQPTFPGTQAMFVGGD